MSSVKEKHSRKGQGSELLTFAGRLANAFGKLVAACEISSGTCPRKLAKVFLHRMQCAKASHRPQRPHFNSRGRLQVEQDTGDAWLHGSLQAVFFLRSWLVLICVKAAVARTDRISTQKL